MLSTQECFFSTVRWLKIVGPHANAEHIALLCFFFYSFDRSPLRAEDLTSYVAQVCVCVFFFGQGSAQIVRQTAGEKTKWGWGELRECIILLCSIFPLCFLFINNPKPTLLLLSVTQKYQRVCASLAAWASKCWPTENTFILYSLCWVQKRRVIYWVVHEQFFMKIAENSLWQIKF